jgi:uncharacterized protein (DUF58 family)
VDVTMRRYGSPRVSAYGAVTVAGLFGALVTGRAELVALVAPVALVLVAGIALAERPTVRADLTVDADRVVEGDAITGRVEIEVTPGGARLDVIVPIDGSATDERFTGWAVDPHTPLEMRMGTTGWGLVRVGPVWVRAHGPFGVVTWQGSSGPTATVRVLPPAGALRALLAPDQARAAAGAHVTRVRGDGLEFAEVRPYAAGDRVRALNWAVSARRGDLWVNQRHPERSADVVLFVDTFADDRATTSFTLDRAVRAAWLLARAHLRGHDRVGVVTFGGYPAWLAPGTGARAQLALCDRLLAAQAAWTEAPRSVRLLAPAAIPPGALVVAITPLHDGRMATALVDLRHRGREVVLVRLDVHDAVAEAARAQPVPDPAVRLWRLECDRRASALAAVGIPTVTWTEDVQAAAVLDHLAQVRRRPAARRTAS